MSTLRTGIASIGVKLPPLAMRVEDLAALRGVDPAKFTVGLGCKELALCPEGYDAATLGTEAARRALARFDGGLDRIGLIAVGTETAKDMSRPLSAFIAEELGLSGAVRSYEVKHACYGGTLALRQALEWRLSGASRGKAALVIATDVALYDLASPGEPTQGAGAVAFVVEEPRVASIDVDSYAYSRPAFDFWRPVGQACPSVQGQLSLDCYKEAAAACFRELVGERSAAEVLGAFRSVSFHVPFPKMVRKAVQQLGETFGWSDEETEAFHRAKVEPTMAWNRLAGNCYTASLWLSVAHQLAGAKVGDRFAAFSYGSGFGAELLGLTAGELAAAGPWVAEVEEDLRARELVDGEGYLRLRGA
jgi:hydroxymethylglutaryl-CoA synthase